MYHIIIIISSCIMPSSFRVSAPLTARDRPPAQVPGVKYVPLVGKVTVAMLERNLLRLIENFHS
jgi:hypothetical protein